MPKLKRASACRLLKRSRSSCEKLEVGLSLPGPDANVLLARSANDLLAVLGSLEGPRGLRFAWADLANSFASSLLT